MFGFFANLFGYLLNVLYLLVQNYGLAIIIFSIIIKLLLLPISIKQQKTMKKTAKIQNKLKEIQFKYKNDQEKMNQETIALYKAENMSPFSGCLSAILQFILLISIFYLVRSPLTYMKKVDADIIQKYTTEITENGEKSAYPEIKIIEEKGNEDKSVYINMNFLGLNLSNVPTKSLNNITVYIIPVLYIISSFISIRMTTASQKKAKDNGSLIIEGENKEEEDSMDAMNSANKSMSYIMPIMSVTIALIAPLGLALYWLINNILMIIERILFNKYLKDEEEQTEN